MTKERPFVGWVSLALDRLIVQLDATPPNSDRALRLRRDKMQLERNFVPRTPPRRRYAELGRAWGVEVPR